MSKTRSIHHIVFGTKRREPTITEAYKKELYSYLFGIIRNKQCFVLRINGMPDHIHLLIDLHPTVALADLVRDIKSRSSVWLRGQAKFPLFDGWGEGYYAVSVGVADIDACKAYIIGQEEHHKSADMMAEMRAFAMKCGLTWYDADWA